MEHTIDKNEFTNRMARLNRSITTFVNESLKEYNLTRSELPYLMTLYNNDAVTQEFFSNLYDLNEATVARALSRLEKKGFIQRVSNPNDKRKRMVSLTEEGKKLSLEMVEAQERFIEKIFMNFSDDEYKDLMKLLNKLFDNITNFCDF